MKTLISISFFTKFLVIAAVLSTLLASNAHSKKSHVDVEQGCKCYANGTSYSPGQDTCLGGSKARCIARSGVGDSARECGWDYLKDGSGNTFRCN